MPAHPEFPELIICILFYHFQKFGIFTPKVFPDISAAFHHIFEAVTIHHFIQTLQEYP